MFFVSGICFIRRRRRSIKFEVELVSDVFLRRYYFFCSFKIMFNFNIDF